jgi:outer membrane protein
MLIAVQYLRHFNNSLYLTVLFALITSWSSVYGATTLQESFQAALKRSETLADREKLIELSENQYSQTWRSILPNLSANGSYLIQDRPTNVLAESFFPVTQPELKLTVRQPLFRGLREFFALQQLEHQTQANKFEYESTSLLLYNDVAQTYHATLAAEENLKNIYAQLKIYDDRIVELTRRVQAGTSSETDLITFQSSRANLISQLETSKATVTTARESYAFVTGLPRDSSLAPVEQIRLQPEPLEKYLSLIEKRPDVLKLVERVDATQQQVKVSKGSYLPTIDIIGNYYFKRQSDVYDGINWDVQALFTVPLFTGGVISAQVRESAIQRERASLELSRLRRQAEQQIRTLYYEYLTDLDSIRALEQSLALSEKNYLFLKRDYQKGLTRNLDVLQALISSHEVRRSLLRLRFEARNTWAQLNTAVGRKPNL